MNPHVVSAKALTQTTRASWSEQVNWWGFRLQLSRAIPLHGGCLTEFSTYQNHQGGISRAQPLSFSNSENCTIHDRPTHSLNRHVTHFTPESRKHVIHNPLSAKSGLGNATTFLESASRHRILNPASSKLSPTRRVTRKMALCFGSRLTGCESLTRGVPSWCSPCPATLRTITVLIQQFLFQD